jgi:hypothetical protein
LITAGGEGAALRDKEEWAVVGVEDGGFMSFAVSSAGIAEVLIEVLLSRTDDELQ